MGLGDSLATIDMGQKVGGRLLCPFLGRKVGSPSNTTATVQLIKWVR